MSGVKGRSGRRPAGYEERRLRVIDKAWQLTAQKLYSDDPDRFAVAKEVVVKDMVNKEKITMNAQISQEEKSILERYIARHQSNPTN